MSAGGIAALVLVPLVAFLWACARNARAFDPHPDVRVDEWHHLYLGILLAGAGGLLGRWWLSLLGLLLALDDAWQHVRQVTGAPLFDSPLHRAYAWVYARVAVVRWLNRQLDRLFHG